MAKGRAGVALPDEEIRVMTQELAKSPADQAKAALASAVDQGSGLDLMTLSTVMVQSGFFPNAESVAQGVVKILAGRELGFPAIASMRHIYVHNGHIGLQATLIATKIRQSGTYDYRILDSTDKRCEIEFLRKMPSPEGFRWQTEGKASFTIEEAQRAGLVKDKSAWTTYPSDLLFARAMTRGQRRYCPDVFGQSVYSEEEIHEIAAAETKLVGGQTLEERIADLMPKEKVAQAAQDNPDLPVEIVKDILIAQEESKAGLGEPYQFGIVQDEPKAADSRSEAAAGTVQVLPPYSVTFTVGKQTFHTQGITRGTLMELFKICPRVDKKYGAGRHSEVLRKEFGVEHRTDLTEEMAERYFVRMKEMLEAE